MIDEQITRSVAAFLGAMFLPVFIFTVVGLYLYFKERK